MCCCSCCASAVNFVTAPFYRFEKKIFQTKKYSTYKVDNHHYEHIDENMEESKGTLIQDIKDMKIFWGDEFEGHIIK